MEQALEDGVVIARVAAIDVGKAEVVCCARVPSPTGTGRRAQDVRRFSTMTRSLMELADWLAGLGVTRVVMEATSDYWKPVFYLLEAAGFETWLVNAKDVKHLPGRPKTDTLDAVWLCKVAERQMLRPSFVPPEPTRRLRDLTRYRIDLVGERRRAKQRVEKLLEDAGIKVSVVASDIFGVSGRSMLDALVAGQRDPKTLAQLARRRLRAKIPALEEAFTGRFEDHHGFLLGRMLAHVDAIDADIAAVEGKIEELTSPFADAVERLDAIPGVGPLAARTIIAEVGLDMSRFPTPAHLATWARSPPGSTSQQASPRPTGPPAMATATWPGCSARPRSARPRPGPSSANATDASPDDEARRRRWSLSAARSWSSSGTCCPTPTQRSSISDPTTTRHDAGPSVRSATTSEDSARSATP
jgi:transposase